MKLNSTNTKLDSSSEKILIPRLGIFDDSEFTLQSTNSPKDGSSKKNIFITTLAKKNYHKIGGLASSPRIQLEGSSFSPRENMSGSGSMNWDKLVTPRLPVIKTALTKKTVELSADMDCTQPKLALNFSRRKTGLYETDPVTALASSGHQKLLQSLKIQSPGGIQLFSSLHKKEEESEMNKLKKVFQVQIDSKSGGGRLSHRDESSQHISNSSKNSTLVQVKKPYIDLGSKEGSAYSIPRSVIKESKLVLLEKLRKKRNLDSEWANQEEFLKKANSNKYDYIEQRKHF